MSDTPDEKTPAQPIGDDLIMPTPTACWRPISALPSERPWHGIPS